MELWNQHVGPRVNLLVTITAVAGILALSAVEAPTVQARLAPNEQAVFQPLLLLPAGVNQPANPRYLETINKMMRWVQGYYAYELGVPEAESFQYEQAGVLKTNLSPAELDCSGNGTEYDDYECARYYLDQLLPRLQESLANASEFNSYNFDWPTGPARETGVHYVIFIQLPSGSTPVFNTGELIWFGRSWEEYSMTLMNEHSLDKLIEANFLETGLSELRYDIDCTDASLPVRQTNICEEFYSSAMPLRLLSHELGHAFNLPHVNPHDPAFRAGQDSFMKSGSIPQDGLLDTKINPMKEIMRSSIFLRTHKPQKKTWRLQLPQAGEYLLALLLNLDHPEPQTALAPLIQNSQLENIRMFNNGAGEHGGRPGSWSGLYSPNVPDFSNSLEQLSPSRGYSIKVSEAVDLTLMGTSLDTQVIPVGRGDNLVPYMGPVLPVSEALATITGKYTEVKTLKPDGSGEMLTYTPDETDQDDFTNMEPGRAYWVTLPGDIRIVDGEASNANYDGNVVVIHPTTEQPNPPQPLLTLLQKRSSWAREGRAFLLDYLQTVLDWLPNL